VSPIAVARLVDVASWRQGACGFRANDTQRPLSNVHDD
jgi:hypothetical protein